MTDANTAPSSPPEEQVIHDPSDLRKYRTELPNLYDDSDLNVYEFRLLAHYKRVGLCRESLPTTATKCRMSEGQVSEMRKTLADKGFITLERKEMGGKRYRYIVRVVDRWIENFARYSGLDPEQIAEQVRQASPSTREGSPSPHEGKKELIKNQERFAAIAQKLSELTGGGLNPYTGDMIADWLDKHQDEWIFKAIEAARSNGARHQNYVDKILIGWEANGYPKSREEKVQGAKRGAHSKRSQTPGSEDAAPEYTDEDRAAAERVRQRKQQRLPAV